MAAKVAGELVRYRDVADIICRQIQGATADTENAALVIVEHLDRLEKQLRDLLVKLGEAERRMEEIAAASGQKAAHMCQAVRDLCQLVDLCTKEVCANREVYACIAVKAESFASALTAISTIVRQTRMLALNASIKVARAGDAGRGFAIKAGGDRTLADEAANADSGIREGLDRLRGDDQRVIV